MSNRRRMIGDALDELALPPAFAIQLGRLAEVLANRARARR
jgi:hypothetical protein